MLIDRELECEIRRRNLLNTYSEYKEQCEKGFSNKNIKRKNKKGFSNLSKDERKGLESLRKRIDEGELYIAQTDKSGRLAVMSTEQ